VFNGIGEVVPAMNLARAAWMAEVFVALFLLVIFVTVLLSTRNERYASELNAAATRLEDDGRGMSDFIRAEYNFETIDAAMDELNRAGAGFIKFLFLISSKLN
jgi:hypothetical protein